MGPSRIWLLGVLSEQAKVLQLPVIQGLKQQDPLVLSLIPTLMGPRPKEGE